MTVAGGGYFEPGAHDDDLLERIDEQDAISPLGHSPAGCDRCGRGVPNLETCVGCGDEAGDAGAGEWGGVGWDQEGPADRAA